MWCKDLKRRETDGESCRNVFVCLSQIRLNTSHRTNMCWRPVYLYRSRSWVESWRLRQVDRTPAWAEVWTSGDSETTVCSEPDRNKRCKEFWAVCFSLYKMHKVWRLKGLRQIEGQYSCHILHSWLEITCKYFLETMYTYPNIQRVFRTQLSKCIWRCKQKWVHLNGRSTVRTVGQQHLAYTANAPLLHYY